VALWWSDCTTTRRVEQNPRKEYAMHSKGSDSAMDVGTNNAPVQECLSLGDWDRWFGISDDVEM
jgi:hypothetical protein